VIQYLWKRGEIIPKIIAVDLSERPENSEQTKYISHCPECQTELVRNEGEVNHYCPNFWMSSKLLEEFNIIFREKQWILKDLVEKQWPYCSIMI
jgi:NAD-dependent DNA ligase